MAAPQAIQRGDSLLGKRATTVRKRQAMDKTMAAGVVGRGANVSTTPTLIGVTEMGGRRYALFEQNGKSLTIEEGGQESGLSVGKINGCEVMVNGARQRVDVGTQEVAVASRQTTAVGVGPAGAVPGVQSVTVAQDMAALKLPVVPDQPYLTGPQPLR